MEEKVFLFITDIHQHIDNVKTLDFSIYDGVICAGDIIDPANQSVETGKKILSLLPDDTFIIPGNCDTDREIYSLLCGMKNCIERTTKQIFSIPIAGIGRSRSLEDDINVYRDYFLDDKTRVDEFINSGGSHFILKYAGINSNKTVIDNKTIIRQNTVFFEKFISYTESELYDIFNGNELTNGILVTHSPPYGVLDKLPGLPHIGSNGVLHCIQIANPTLILSGHFHELAGIVHENGRIYFNPGSLKDGYYGVIHVKDTTFDCLIKKI